MNNYNNWYEIFHLLSLKTQIAILITCSTLKNNLPIVKFNNKKYKFYDTTVQNMLKKDLFQFVVYLEINYKSLIDVGIKDISCIRNLKILHIFSLEKMGKTAIAKLDLIELNPGYNSEHIHISHMTNLKVLHADYKSSIDQFEWDNLDLYELYMYDNNDVHNISHMKNLKVLEIGRCENINQNQIKNLDLISLAIDPNFNTTNLSHMKNLKFLNAYLCDLDSLEIDELNLIELIIDNRDFHVLKKMKNTRIRKGFYYAGTFIEYQN